MPAEQAKAVGVAPPDACPPGVPAHPAVPEEDQPGASAMTINPALA
jgi:hypothetical protein